MATQADVFEGLLERLPRGARREILCRLREAILWRGWDACDSALTRKCCCHACLAVRDIVDVFARHGVEFEEYT